MKLNIKEIIRELIYRIAKRTLLVFKKGYLYDIGWFETLKTDKSCNKTGENIPWMAYSFINFIEPRLNQNMSVFEYGCGYSTSWWAKRTKCITSIEHNHEWYTKIKKQVPSNSQIEYIPLEVNGEYSRAITKYNEKFDIVIIDGRDRVNCVKNIGEHISQDGIIIFDDTERERYIKGYQILENWGFKRIDFIGLKPGGLYSTQTTIFYRSNNCLGI